jgi:DNA-directed RNA polymerase subunit RPC12/RpoP
MTCTCEVCGKKAGTKNYIANQYQCDECFFKWLLKYLAAGAVLIFVFFRIIHFKN